MRAVFQSQPDVAHVYLGSKRSMMARLFNDAMEYGARHGLPGSSSLQKALDALVGDEVVAKLGPGEYRIAEPFLAEWVRAHGL